MNRASLSVIGATLLSACTARVAHECKPEFADDCADLQALQGEITDATSSTPDPATICNIADRTIEKVFEIFTSHPWQPAEDVREDIFEGQSTVSAVFLPAYPGYDPIDGMQCYFQQDHTVRDAQTVACRLDSGTTGFTPDISFHATSQPGHLVKLPFYPPDINAGICSQREAFSSWGEICVEYKAHLGAKDIDNSEPESAAILDDPRSTQHTVGDRIVADPLYAQAKCPEIPMDEIVARIERMFNFVRGKIEGI